MNDFTIVECSQCQRKEKRLNFSYCNDCDKIACNIQEESCGIYCPICDWFICSGCCDKHSAACWDVSPEVRVIKRDDCTIYRFSQLEPHKLDSKYQIYSNENGITEVQVKI